MKEYMTDLITHYKERAFDKWGNPTITSTDIKCRFEYKTKLVKDITGAEVVSGAVILFDGDYDISHKDKIEYDGIKHAIINIARLKHFDIEYKEVYLS